MVFCNPPRHGVRRRNKEAVIFFKKIKLMARPTHVPGPLDLATMASGRQSAVGVRRTGMCALISLLIAGLHVCVVIRLSQMHRVCGVNENPRLTTHSGFPSLPLAPTTAWSRPPRSPHWLILQPHPSLPVVCSRYLHQRHHRNSVLPLAAGPAACRPPL